MNSTNNPLFCGLIRSVLLAILILSSGCKNSGEPLTEANAKDDSATQKRTLSQTESPTAKTGESPISGTTPRTDPMRASTSTPESDRLKERPYEKSFGETVKGSTRVTLKRFDRDRLEQDDSWSDDPSPDSENEAQSDEEQIAVISDAAWLKEFVEAVGADVRPERAVPRCGVDYTLNFESPTEQATFDAVCVDKKKVVLVRRGAYHAKQNKTAHRLLESAFSMSKAD